MFEWLTCNLLNRSRYDKLTKITFFILFYYFLTVLYFKTVLKNVYIFFWYALCIPVSTINSLVWSWKKREVRSRLSRLFLNYLSENSFDALPIYSLRNHEVIQSSLNPNELVRSWMWIAWSGPLRLFFDYFFSPWNYFKPIYRLFVKIFTFLTVLSILVSAIELVEAIRALFELFYLNYFKTMFEYVLIFWYDLSITVSTVNSLVWSWMGIADH